MKKTVFITGASSGIGKETAINLLKNGYEVIAAARRVDLMKDLESLGALVISMDITKEAEVQSAVREAIAKKGKIDVLLNNAGYAIYGAVEDISIKEAKQQFDVNLFGLARITQEVLPHMRNNNAGSIINMSSMAGKTYTPLGAWYHASKFALEGWSDCLRLELKQFDINVVLIEPGGIKTEFDEVMLEPLLERSKNSVYELLAKRVAAGTKKIYDGRASKPKVISDLILKAIQSESPKHRYIGGFMAKPSVFIRKYFGSKLWDKLVMKIA